MPSYGSESDGWPRWRGAIVALALLIASAAAATAIWVRLPDTALEVQLLPPDDPVVQLDREITAEFGMQNPVVWVVAARQGTVWTEHILGQVQTLTREVFRIPGVIPTEVMSIASPNVRDLRATEDMLEPVYLMGRVPERPEELEALRRRVESNANYHGTLVSLDGRAAMVVADFRTDADSQVVASGAVAIRDRHRDARTAVYVAGAPVLQATAPRRLVPMAAMALLIVACGAAALVAVGGIRAVAATVAAAVLAALWTTAGVVVADEAVLPWSAYGALPIVLVSAVFATAGRVSWREHLGAAAALLLGFVALGLVAGVPARALGVTGCIGMAAALLAGRGAQALVGCGGEPGCPGRWTGLTAAVLVVLAALGLANMRGSLALFGYGERYLPAGAGEDLRAIAAHFPPPTALAVRVSGEAGFIKSPAVLTALDKLTDAVRDDPAVVRTLSLADLIKMVHRAFNGNRAEFFTIPQEPGMAGRYLLLAYSPGFRRFVNRAFSQSAVWVYLSSDSAADLARVRATLEKQLAAHPVPGAEADVAGGDGAIVLSTMRVVRRLAWGVLAFVGVAAAAVALLVGHAVGARVFVGGVCAGVFAGGTLGWMGIPVDLLSLPWLIAAIVAGAAFGLADSTRPLGFALAAMGLLAICTSYASASLLGAVVGVCLLAPAVAGSVVHDGAEIAIARLWRREPR